MDGPASYIFQFHYMYEGKKDDLYGCCKNAKLTFIMSSIVLRTMSVMMKYSKGVETTTRQILYLKLSISRGMYRSRGLADIAKSMHDFCKTGFVGKTSILASFLQYKICHILQIVHDHNNFSNDTTTIDFFISGHQGSYSKYFFDA